MNRHYVFSVVFDLMGLSAVAGGIIEGKTDALWLGLAAFAFGSLSSIKADLKEMRDGQA